ncbi:MAG: chemotaxis protein CheW [Chloroflexi bacterium]|nr:chemotaxis protein CheW [Chloroflexota bacterium]
MEEPFLQDHIEDEPEEAEPGEPHLIFCLGDAECAARVDSVLAIERVLPTTRVPRAVPWVVGIANLRGSLVTIVDVRSLMGMPRLTPTQYSRIVFASNGEAAMGLLVDRVSDIHYLRQSEIRSPRADCHNGLTPYLRGVYQSSDRTLLVIDIIALLRCEKMRDLCLVC